MDNNDILAYILSFIDYSKTAQVCRKWDDLAWKLRLQGIYWIIVNKSSIKRVLDIIRDKKTPYQVNYKILKAKIYFEDGDSAELRQLYCSLMPNINKEIHIITDKLLSHVLSYPITETLKIYGRSSEYAIFVSQKRTLLIDEGIHIVSYTNKIDTLHLKVKDDGRHEQLTYLNNVDKLIYESPSYSSCIYSITCPKAKKVYIKAMINPMFDLTNFKSLEELTIIDTGHSSAMIDMIGIPLKNLKKISVKNLMPVSMYLLKDAPNVTYFEHTDDTWVDGNSIIDELKGRITFKKISN
jgi:hypothetical protein